MADPMRIRANMTGDKVEVKVLMAHEMETGLRKDAGGNAIPAHFIRNVTVTHGGKTVLSAQWGTSVSRNPFLHFRFKGGKPGVVKGAYVRLPRYFADTDRVQDLESRLVTCMVTLQGFTPEEARRSPFSGTGAPMITTDPFSGVGQRSVMTDLVAWIASESRGMTIAPPMSHPKERLAYQAGERLFYYRAGPYDFGCVTCHGEEGKRIRLQNLPKMTNAKDAQRAFGTWPAYRVSEGELRSMQWRMWECIRQMRFPELEFASDASIALITYLANKAEGGTLDAPAIKR